MRVLPRGEFDGQVFIDAFRVEWRFDQQAQCWRRKGRTDIIPIANSATIGLLSSNLKFLLDRVPPKGGGFAVVTRPHLQFRSQNNPDGVMFGDIDLVSDTLNIKCVHSDGREIGDACFKVCFKETDEEPPGFDLNFSDKFLRTVCVEVPGGPGLPGEKGLAGIDGNDGTGDGSQGLTGDSGEDAGDRHIITGVKIIDLEEITDTALVKLELDPNAGKLFATKGRVKVPDNEEAAADRIIVAQINRGLKFTGNCFDYSITLLPCRADDDFDTLDPAIAYYPSHFNPDEIVNDADRKFQMVSRNLSDMVNETINFYQSKLNEASDKYDKQIEEFIVEKDKEARMVLDQLGDRLAKCENITYLDYCIGLGDRCVENEAAAAGTPAVDIPASSPDCAVIAEAVSAPGAGCQVLSTLAVLGGSAPVFSFDAPDSFQIQFAFTATPPPGEGRINKMTCPDGCWVRNGGALQFLGPGSKVPAGWVPVAPPNGGPEPVVTIRGQEAEIPGQTQREGNTEAINDLIARLSAGKTFYKKQQFRFSQLADEFPPGTYAFVYVGGAFTQTRLSEDQAFVENVNSDTLVQGAFQEYWVGNEGVGKGLGPFGVIDPIQIQPGGFNNDYATTEIGLEIGFVPSPFTSGLPADYFDKHKFTPNVEVGNAALEIPNPRTDFEAIGQSAFSVENRIMWKKFPIIQGSHTDASALQSAYIDGPVSLRFVSFKTTQTGVFFARVKSAFSTSNVFGTLVMPPIGPSLTAFNRPSITLKTPRQSSTGVLLKYPVINARPIPDGQVQIQAIKITEPEAAPPTTAGSVTPEGQ